MDYFLIMRGVGIMELMFVWLKEYGVFKDISLHFDRRFSFEIKNGMIHIKKSNNYEHINRVNSYLFGESNIKNVTTIVGDNGAGKTTILESVKYYCNTTIDDDKSGAIFACLEVDAEGNEIINVFLYGKDQFDIHSPEVKITKHINNQDFFKSTKIISLSNLLDYSDYLEPSNGNIDNLTVGGLIKRDYKKELDYLVDKQQKNNVNHITNFYTYEVQRQLAFFNSYRERFDHLKLPIKIPKKLSIEVTNSRKRFENMFNEKKDIQELKSLVEKLLNQTRNCIFFYNREQYKGNGEGFYRNLLENIILNLIKDIAIPISTNYRRVEEFEVLKTTINKINQNQNITLVYYIESFIHELMNIESISKYRNLLEPYSNFFQWVKKIINNDEIMFGQPFDLNTMQIELSDRNYDMFSEMFKKYNATAFTFPYLKFFWSGLSTGEYNMLNTFAKIYSVLKDSKVVNHLGYKVSCENIWILIDEIDSTFHPTWQSDFMTFLLKFVQELFKEYNVQIILTTHSPILLSDFANHNVIYLKQGIVQSNEGHQKTFAQNIYTLFSDAFFVKRPRGAFAEQILFNIEYDLMELSNGKRKNSQNKILQLKAVIQEIGETVIREAYEDKLAGLEDKFASLEGNSTAEKLQNIKNTYKQLSLEEKDTFIQYIIDSSNKGENHD